MLAVAVEVSPSLSVTVAVRVIRLSAERLTGSLGLAALGCDSARIWSSVTVPPASTLTVNTSWLVVAVRPSTTPPFITRLTASPLATSISPLGPATAPSVKLPTVPAPSAP